MIRIQPTCRIKLGHVLSPQDLGRIDPNDGDGDKGALGNEDAIDELAGGGTDGVGEWEVVVGMYLRISKMKAEFKKSYKSHYAPPYWPRTHLDVS